MPLEEVNNRFNEELQRQKDTYEWVGWVNQGKGLYYNKNKVLNFLYQQLENPADLDLQESLEPYVSAVKIIQDFENPIKE
jgi:hypothetical protein